MRISDWSSDVCSSDLDAEIAEADTRLYGRFGQAAAADRIVVQVFGADRLIAIAADRAAATRVESARRRAVEKRRAAALAEAQTSGEDIVVRPERHIRTAERRGGTGVVNARRSRWAPYADKKNRNK